jgi:hypothetical protein
VKKMIIFISQRQSQYTTTLGHEKVLRPSESIWLINFLLNTCCWNKRMRSAVHFCTSKKTKWTLNNILYKMYLYIKCSLRFTHTQKKSYFSSSLKVFLPLASLVFIILDFLSVTHIKCVKCFFFLSGYFFVKFRF